MRRTSTLPEVPMQRNTMPGKGGVRMEIDDTLLESGKAALGAVLEAVQRVREGLAEGEGYDAEADLASIEASVGQCMSVLDGDAPEAVPAPEGGGELKTTANPEMEAMMRAITALGNEVKAMRGEKAKESAAEKRAAEKKAADDVFNLLVSGEILIAEERDIFDAVASKRGLSGASDHFKAKGRRAGLPVANGTGLPGDRGAIATGKQPETADVEARRAALDVEYKKHGILDEKTRKSYVDGALKREAEIEYERMN